METETYKDSVPTTFSSLPMKLEQFVREILQKKSISLTYKTHLRDLFDKLNINSVNERNYYSEPNLFNTL